MGRRKESRKLGRRKRPRDLVCQVQLGTCQDPVWDLKYKLGRILDRKAYVEYTDVRLGKIRVDEPEGEGTRRESREDEPC